MHPRRILTPSSALRAFLALSLVVVAAAPLVAITPPDSSSPAAAKAFRNPDLHIPAVYRVPTELGPVASGRAISDLAKLGIVQPRSARLDLRGGRWATLMPSARLLPGVAGGKGAELDRATSVRPTRQEAVDALLGYLEAHRAELRIDPAELARPGRVAIHDDGEVIQISLPRVYRGVPVRGSYLTAVINHGNLVLLGAVKWGDIEVSTRAGLSRGEAVGRVQQHVDPLTIAGTGKSSLVLVPLARGREASQVVVGRGFAHRLAWVVRPHFADDLASWEALVDAHSGELLSFEDTNQYATSREIKGGVFPVSNDGTAPDGVEQPGWPMPFETLATGGGPVTTDSGGNAYCIDGDVTANHSGPFVHMNDECGAASLTSAGDVNWGTSGGTDCVTPGVGGAGNTHASRTGFHELNRIIQQAKGQLPDNGWLGQQLVSNMNIDDNCNAFWNGTVNFFTSGGGCGNTGELAGVFDHEWGHGMDNNDALPSISNPGEGIADLYAYFRLNTSCIGRGFRLGTNCGGYGDPCLDCDGVRDIDWAKKASGAPHDVLWADSECGSFGSTPCGGSTHCEGHVYSEAVYDLVNRDLPALFGMDHNTASEIGARLTYLGAGLVGSWFTCNYIDPPFPPPAVIDPYNGCNADGGYLNYLAVDDDNGNLNDGTPHMSAIFAAFDRHGIACDAPAVADSGCAGGPTVAPTVTATALDRGVALAWGAVAGASKYQVFRTDGVFACDFGKIKIGETTGTSFTDEGLQNGRDYSYVVIPIGPADSCMGPASSCDTVAPVAGDNLALDASTVSMVINSGDGDAFLDNCETATVSFDVFNTGNAAQANVRIDDVRPISHPGISVDGIDSSALGALGVCGVGSGSFDISADGLAFGDAVTFEVDLTSDELAPVVKTSTVTVAINAESDVMAVASQTWDFESNLEDWTLIQGTFNQTTSGGGADGSAGYVASSAFLDSQCDQVRSPALRLTGSSTLEAWTNYEIEAFSSQWWDRANVAVLDGAARNAVSPDSGRPYVASGDGGACVVAGQVGWADAAESWASSGWSAGALGSAGYAGKVVHLDVAYGTDPAENGKGFWFDKVTLTDFELLVADAQSDVCNTPPIVTIIDPGDEDQFDAADSIGFEGTATDAEDLVLTPSLDWTSNIDGSIGTGGTFSQSLSRGYHTVTAAVTDSGGLDDSDEINLVVTDGSACTAEVAVSGTTVTGPTSLAAVKEVAIGSATILDGSGGTVEVKAGKEISLADDVELIDSVSLVNTPTPCD